MVLGTTDKINTYFTILSVIVYLVYVYMLTIKWFKHHRFLHSCWCKHMDIYIYTNINESKTILMHVSVISVIILVR